MVLLIHRINNFTIRITNIMPSKSMETTDTFLSTPCKFLSLNINLNFIQIIKALALNLIRIRTVRNPIATPLRSYQPSLLAQLSMFLSRSR